MSRPPKRPPAPAGETRDRILDAAEAQIARYGINGASLRDITGAAGVNVAAVNYHFGSKEGLVAALLERRISPVNAERMARFDALESAPTITLRPVLEAFVGPVIAAASAAPHLRDTFLIVMVRLKTGGDRKTRDLYHRHFAEVWGRFISLLTRALPGRPRRELEALAALTVALVTGAIHHPAPDPDEPPCGLSLPRLLDYAEGAFAGPAGKRKR